jgi:hypothetical protein
MKGMEEVRKEGRKEGSKNERKKERKEGRLSECQSFEITINE